MAPFFFYHSWWWMVRNPERMEAAERSFYRSLLCLFWAVSVVQTHNDGGTQLVRLWQEGELLYQSHVSDGKIDRWMGDYVHIISHIWENSWQEEDCAQTLETIWSLGGGGILKSNACVLPCFHIEVSPEVKVLRCPFILNMSTQAVSTISKKARTYCDRLVERLGIGIWTQVAVDVWAHEGREGDRAVTEQGAAGLQG